MRRAKDMGRTLLYLLLALPVGAAAAVVLVAGWALCALLAITPLVVPALVAFRAAVGAVARADAEVANVAARHDGAAADQLARSRRLLAARRERARRRGVLAAAGATCCSASPLGWALAVVELDARSRPAPRRSSSRSTTAGRTRTSAPGTSTRSVVRSCSWPRACSRSCSPSCSSGRSARVARSLVVGLLAERRSCAIRRRSHILVRCGCGRSPSTLPSSSV